jgi:hypothetical protein
VTGNKNNRITFRVSKTEKDFYDSVAAHEKMPLSLLIRRLLDKEFRLIVDKKYGETSQKNG